MSTPRLVIVDGVRTPFCKMGTDLAALSADELGRIATQVLLTRTGLDPALIDEVIFGCVGQPADAANVARVIALRAGIPEHVPAITVHRNCASGLESLTQAYEKMTAGRGTIFLVGGIGEHEQLSVALHEDRCGEARQARPREILPRKSLRPHRLPPRRLQAPHHLQLGLTDPVCGMNMGDTAELLARESGLSREEQDAFALESHQRAAAAKAKLAEEICPVFPTLASGKSTKPIVADNGVRESQTMEALAKLRPVFDRHHGTVTAGNASQITDGAVALLVMTEERAAELGFTPLGALLGYAYAGCDPSRMGLGPVYAIAKAEEKTGLAVNAADLIEINEAFAAQTLAVLKCCESEQFAKKMLGRSSPVGEIRRDRLNVNGGAIALGHPVGATGARLVLASLKELKRQNLKRALVSVCVGGGQGAAIWLEAL